MKQAVLVLAFFATTSLGGRSAYGGANVVEARGQVVEAPIKQAAKPAAKKPGPPPSVAGTDVPRMETAALQLRHATTLKLAMRGVDGDARESARRAAVAAYRAVRGYHPAEVQACAEAAFRAGELLRAGTDIQGALAEFTFARERGGESPFRMRAALEMGHVFRRAGEHQRALTTYESVLADPAATPRQRDDASLWAGHVYCDLERPDDARRVWERVAGGAEDPLDRVRAYDSLALLSIADGDLEAASAVLERCRDALQDTENEETKLGERVRSALASMRALDDLERAVQRKTQLAPSDAGTKPASGANRGDNG